VYRQGLTVYSNFRYTGIRDIYLTKKANQISRMKNIPNQNKSFTNTKDVYSMIIYLFVSLALVSSTEAMERALSKPSGSSAQEALMTSPEPTQLGGQERDRNSNSDQAEASQSTEATQTARAERASKRRQARQVRSAPSSLLKIY
jgi:hypothetical protein